MTPQEAPTIQAPSDGRPPGLKLTRKDFVPREEVRWCPGCGDYAVLAQVQKVLPTLGIAKEDFVFVSGIGCSSRFPYYIDTYGVHGIHGRAPAIATGIKLARPNLSVWVVTGDGDAFAIGTSHVVHAMRRNVDLKILLFNNRIYGLTKGQVSPTSELGKRTKSTPLGSVSDPLDPLSIALAAGATFVARVLATDTQRVARVVERAARHRGAAFVEILQNCVIFNDGAFDEIASGERLFLDHGQPLIWGPGKALGMRGATPVVVPAGDPSALVHDETSEPLAMLLARLDRATFPPVLGIFRAVTRPTYDARVTEQVAAARARASASVQRVLESGETWIVEGR
jgi:2-oxoglutarate/2-oxoacid ferredoxin oxidoreductase subunit beta